MKYKILSSSLEGTTITTKVEYDFDGIKLTVDVPHFMPENQAAIEQGIINRAITEKKNLDAIVINEALVSEIIIGEQKTIE